MYSRETVRLTHQDVYKLDAESHHYQYSVFVIITVIIIILCIYSIARMYYFFYESHEGCLIRLILIKVKRGPTVTFGSVDYTFQDA